MPKTRTPTPPLKERKHFDVLETSGRNTIPGKDFSSNHNIYSPETNISLLLPGHQSPRQGWHGLSPFNLTIPPSPRASRHVTKIYRSTMKQRHAQSLLLLACQPATDWLLESNGYGSTFPFIIPEILFRGGRGGVAHRDSQIESSPSFLSFLVPWQEGYSAIVQRGTERSKHKRFLRGSE